MGPRLQLDGGPGCVCVCGGGGGGGGHFINCLLI